MAGYKQLTYEERVKISVLQQSNSSLAEIALALGRHKSTISRELRRNEAPPGQYWPDTAQRLSQGRRKRGCKIDRYHDLKEFIYEKMTCEFWSPEQMAGWLKNRQNKLPKVCHETIYAWIYQGAQKAEKLWKFLPRHKAKRGLRKYRSAGMSRIPERKSIHERAPKILKRKEFGHWEGDLMSFCKNSQHMLVLQERKSRFIRSERLPSKRAQDTIQEISKLLKPFPKEALKTITFDNGGEFAAHNQLQKDLGIQTFFCDPYASWQKGGVENGNKRLRRDLPRKTNIHKMRQEDFEEVIQNYNMTPRKCLKWLTPLEAFSLNFSRVALQT